MASLRPITRLAPAVRLATIICRTITTTIKRLDDQDQVSAKEVPVSTYSGDQVMNTGETHILTVDQTPPPIATPIMDVAKQAFALDKGVAKHLTPTLKKFTLQDKVAIITGGARGLGWNMAQAIAEVGAKAVAILDYNQELGDQGAAELHEQTGIPCHFYKVDIRDGKAIAEVVHNVAATFGSVDVVINSAGIADSNIKAEDYDHHKWDNLLAINVTGAFLIAQASGRQMIAQGTGGSIIFIASMSGSIVNYPQEQCCYNASKAAVIQLSKSLAAEWAQYKIRVNCISPGYMDTALNRFPALEGQKKIWTSMTPQNRLGDSDELNNLAVFLASDASTFMTGSNCVIDGGYSVY